MSVVRGLDKAMKNIFESIRKNWRKIISAALIFLVIFAVLFWAVNLDFGSKTPAKTYSSDSFSGKLGEDFQKKIGATDVYQLAYNEWADYFELPANFAKYDDDPDGDGLPNYLEYVHATDPTKADTDKDGFTDRQEITNGYDPDAPGDAKPKVDIEIKKMQIQVPMVWSETEDENAMLEYYKSLNERYRLAILEDPLSEDAWGGWKKLNELLSSQLLIVGDDLLATNPKRVEKAIAEKVCNAILVKPNQIGTVTETLKVIKMAKDAGWKIIVSHRSGETNDHFIADFAVGVGAEYCKFGAPARGERVAKYNRLIRIEEKTSLRYGL